jgi:hypothetical protein
MEDGRYRVDLELTPSVPLLNEAEGHERVTRLNVYLPVGAKVVCDHYHAAFNSFDVIVEISAPTVVEALAEVARSLAHLSIAIREEHDKDPMGPMPTLRRCVITPAPERSSLGSSPTS